MHVHGARAPGGDAARGGRLLTFVATPATEEEERGWDALVAQTGRDHILQRRPWADVKAATAWRARRFVIARDGEHVGVAQVLVKALPLGIQIAYAPRGPLVEPADLPGAIAALRAGLRDEPCASLLCDPEVPDDAALRHDLARSGTARGRVFVQPRRTLLMDLSLTADELLSRMRKKTRQYIHKAEREGVVTEETDDVARFHAVLAKVAQRDAFGIHDRAYFSRLLAAFGANAHLLMARVGDDDTGALLLVRSGERAWEMFGGWSGEHAEHRPFYLLKWRSLMRMQQLGVTRYDMWGLSDSSDDALAGVENFKLGFGGETQTWIGPLETPVRRWLFPVWQYGARRRLARSAA